MSRVYKRFSTTVGGQRTQSPRWQVEIIDHLGTVRRLAGFESESLTRELERNLNRLVRCAQHRELPPPELNEWLRVLPRRIKSRLLKWGLLDARRDANTSPIKDHLETFKTHLKAKGNTGDHVNLVHSRVERIIDGTRAKRWSDITEDKVKRYLTELQEGKHGPPISAQTFTHHVRNIKQFCKWMVRTDRALKSPVENLETQNVKAARKRERRYLLHDEWPWLRCAAENGPIRLGMTGHERALLYAAAIQTGLRASELRALTRSSLVLHEVPPYIVAKAGTTKNKRTARQSVNLDLAVALRAHNATKAPQAPVFAIPNQFRAADMLRKDLAEARSAFLETARDNPGLHTERDESDFLLERNHDGEVLDFHSLRHTCGVWLAMTGAHPKVIQSVMRHSTITLTMDTYGHLFPGQEADAVARLPVMLGDLQQMQATGTDGPKRP